MSLISLCGFAGGNTGGIDCDVQRGNAKAILIGSASFNSSATLTSASFKTALLAAINQATGVASKVYPFPQIRTVTNNTEANREATLGDGFKVTLAEGKPAYTFESYIGANQEKKLRRFNGVIAPIFIFDDNGNVWGKKDNAGNFVGIKAQVYVTGAGFGNYGDAPTCKVTVNFLSASDFFDNGFMADTDFDVTDLEGLQDAKLVFVSKATNVHKFSILVENVKLGADINIFDYYPTQLVVGLWKATVVATGANLTITSVTFDTANKLWVVTFDSTAYTALGANSAIKVELVAPNLLFAANVTGLESVAVITTNA